MEKLIEKMFNRACLLDPIFRARIIATTNPLFALYRNGVKTHPLMKKFGFKDEQIYIHAEIAALAGPRISVEGRPLYVVRAKKLQDGTFVSGLAKPCKGCMQAILEFGISELVYTLDGTKEERIKWETVRL